VVFWRDPAAGKLVKVGRRVRIAVSLGVEEVMVPDLAQQPLQRAFPILEASNLQTGAIQRSYDEYVMAGRIIRQDPPSGASVAADTPVTVIVSRGRKPVPMPSLIGRTAQDAQDILESFGLQADLSLIGSAPLPFVLPDVVIDQAPVSGTAVRPGLTPIVLIVSATPAGPAQIPQTPVEGRYLPAVPPDVP
jgi:serine/threonine-protein kinase